MFYNVKCHVPIYHNIRFNITIRWKNIIARKSVGMKIFVFNIMCVIVILCESCKRLSFLKRRVLKAVTNKAIQIKIKYDC